MSDEAVILDVVEKLYTAALNDDHWTEPLDAMADLFGAVGVSFEVFENVTRKPIVFELGTDLDVVSEADYMDYYGPLSPRVAHGVGKPSGYVSYDHLILSDAEIDRDEFYTDCIGPVGLRYFIAAQPFTTQSHSAVFAAQRSPRQGHVGEREISAMQRLVPHLQQATDLKFRLAARRFENKISLDSLEHLDEGCLIVDRAGKALHMNSLAREIVALGDGVGMIRDRLVFADKKSGDMFRRALGELHPEEGEATDLTARDFPALRREGKRPYLISIRPLPNGHVFLPHAWPAAAMVFIRDPARFARLDTPLLRQSYRLSEIEADLAAALDRGSAVSDVAREREVSITTVRSQLYSLMAKLDVRRQTDLISLLAKYRRPHG